MQTLPVTSLIFHKAKCGCKAITSVLVSPAFWIGTSVSFPVEHYIWERVYPFYVITKFLGL